MVMQAMRDYSPGIEPHSRNGGAQAMYNQSPVPKTRGMVRGDFSDVIGRRCFVNREFAMWGSVIRGTHVNLSVAGQGVRRT